MKHILTLLISLALYLPLSAETIMKITLSGAVEEDVVGSFSKIVFQDNMMIAGDSYDMTDVKKIEFYTSATSVEEISWENPKQMQIITTGNQLKLNSPTVGKMNISLYSMNGRKVAELFNGTGAIGEMNISLSNSGLAAGVYSLVVKSNNSLIVRKVAIQ